jgi:hypothetical protein
MMNLMQLCQCGQMKAQFSAAPSIEFEFHATIILRQTKKHSLVASAHSQSACRTQPQPMLTNNFFVMPLTTVKKCNEKRKERKATLA